MGEAASGVVGKSANDWDGHDGTRWVEHQQWLDRMLAAFGDAAIATAAPQVGEHVLDVGCGAGTTSFALADRVGPDGHVLGLDISNALIARARRKSRDGARLSFLVGDAGRAPLRAGGFDLLFSRFGVMFFDDPVAAFGHLRTALRPGGRLTFVCWRGAGENDWVKLPMGAVRGIVPPAPPLPPGAPGPFAFGDADHVTQILRDAGFDGIALAPFDHDIVFGEGVDQAAAVENALHMAFEVGPLSRALAGQPETVRSHATDAVRAAFQRKAEGNVVKIDGAAWIVTAHHPG